MVNIFPEKVTCSNMIIDPPSSVKHDKDYNWYHEDVRVIHAGLAVLHAPAFLRETTVTAVTTRGCHGDSRFNHLDFNETPTRTGMRDSIPSRKILWTHSKSFGSKCRIFKSSASSLVVCFDADDFGLLLLLGMHMTRTASHSSFCINLNNDS